MNPLKRFKNYIIGDALAKTDDVFEKARIDLTYNITVFFLLLGLMYYGNLIAGHYTWLICIISFAVVSLPMVLVVLKKTGSVRLAGFFFVTEQLITGLFNEWIMNFHVGIDGGFWSMVVILFAFFVLGTKWGWIIASYSIFTIFLGLLNEQSGFSLFHFDIPPEQVPPQLPFFIFVPLMICIYSIHHIVVTRRAAEEQIKSQKVQLELSNKELEAQKEDILGSITYAQRIQRAVLPSEEIITRSVPLSFILFKPRDIVSGDFYWFHETDDKNYILVMADCTGHGVPGAFMTVIGSSLLNQTVIENKITQPSKILLEIDHQINIMLKQGNTREQGVQDGMDLSLLRVNKSKKEFTFTSAKRPAVFIPAGAEKPEDLIEIKGSKFSLGGMGMGEKQFEEITIPYHQDDIIYFFSDGYSDQFGGPKQKKFSVKRLKGLLYDIHKLSMNEQKQKLDKAIEDWKGGLEQIDDVCVIGIRF